MEPIFPEVGWMKERFQVRILNDGNKEVLQASGVFYLPSGQRKLCKKILNLLILIQQKNSHEGNGTY